MTMGVRPNEEWVAALRGESEHSSDAVRDLEGYLQRILRRTLNTGFGAEAIDELVQESVARIVEKIDTFRGDAAFPTWAAAIAMRVGFTELRRRRTRDGRREEFDEVLKEARALAARRSPSPADAAEREDVFAALRRAIETRLTERQRAAILAELRGLPTVEIAARLRTNQNALYKLTHDARKKLRAALLESGFTAECFGRATTEMPR